MSYFLDFVQTRRIVLTSAATTESYAAVVGTVEVLTEKPIVGQSGTHLQFYVKVSATEQYQVDVNVQSEDNSEIQMYVGDETLVVQTGSTPFGDPAYGVYTNAELSYAAIGLTNQEFVSYPAQRVESQLEAALNQATFVAVFGQTFDDPGPNGLGIHETHLNTDAANQDGAVAVYMVPTGGGTPVRRWFFFKFDDQSIP
jgi:hypothetical protein